MQKTNPIYNHFTRIDTSKSICVSARGGWTTSADAFLGRLEKAPRPTFTKWLVLDQYDTYMQWQKMMGTWVLPAACSPGSASAKYLCPDMCLCSWAVAWIWTRQCTTPGAAVSTFSGIGLVDSEWSCSCKAFTRSIFAWHNYKTTIYIYVSTIKPESELWYPQALPWKQLYWTAKDSNQFARSHSTSSLEQNHLDQKHAFGRSSPTLFFFAPVLRDFALVSRNFALVSHQEILKKHSQNKPNQDRTPAFFLSALQSQHVRLAKTSIVYQTHAWSVAKNMELTRRHDYINRPRLQSFVHHAMDHQDPWLQKVPGLSWLQGHHISSCICKIISFEFV